MQSLNEPSRVREVDTSTQRLFDGDCALVAPGVFRVDEIAEVIGEGPADQILEAARACPAGAITVVDADSGDQVYP